MSNVIDVLIEFDVDSMPPLSQDQANPTNSLNEFVHLRVKDANGISGQGGAELNFKGEVGDNVRWRATSLSGNFEKSVILYDFAVLGESGGAELSEPKLHGGVKKGKALTTKIMTPIQSQERPLPTELIVTPYNFLESTLEAAGQLTYTFSFQVNDSGSGDLIGYGVWDPYITIED